MCKAISNNMSGNQQPVRKIAKMNLKSFNFGSLTVLATLILTIAPIPFSALYFLEPASAQTTQDRKAEADRLIQQGFQLYRTSRYREAIQVFASALEIYRDIKNRNGEATSLLGLGSAYDNLGQYQKAIDFYQQSLAVFNEIKDRAGGGIILNNLGNAHDRLRQYKKAIEFYNQSLVIAKEVKDRDSEVQLLNKLGSAFFSIEDYEKSIAIYSEVLKLYQQIDDQNSQTQTLKEIGRISTIAGNKFYNALDLAKAIKFHQKALEIHKFLKDTNNESLNLAILGNSYEILGQYAKAEKLLFAALDIARENSNLSNQCFILRYLGELHHYSLKQYAKALDYHQLAATICQKVGDGATTSISLGNMGFTLIELNETSRALKLFQQALNVKTSEYIKSYSLYGFGLTYFKLGKYSEAISVLSQSLSSSKKNNNTWVHRETLSTIGDLLKQQNQIELSIIFYKESVNATEEIRKKLRTLNKEEQKSYLATVEKTYRNLADLLLKQDRILEAQQILDLLKVQELSDYFRSAEVGDSAKKADYQPPEQNIIALGNELAKLQQLDTLTREQEQRLAYLTNQESDRNEQFNAFLNSPEVQKQIKQLTIEKAKNVDLEAYNTLRTSLTEIKNAVVFYPLILEDRLELILITANTAPIRKTVNIKREDLNKDISDFLSNLRDPSSADVQADGQKFYNYLLKPFEKELKDTNIQTIIYSPDGQLRYIPLAALHDGNQWLIERYRINNITASSLTNLRPRTYKPPKVLAAAATNSHNIKLGDRSIPFGALPATKTEVEAIATLLPKTTTLIDQQFSKNVTLQEMKRNTIIHLATHGYFAVGRAEDSFIIFGDGDKATLTDIANWSLTNVSLVVLSACETAIGGKLGSGVEILGLGYRIQDAGAGAAIASLWKVSDDGTSELMQKLYKNLSQKNISSSEALRQAQIAMIRSNKKATSSDRANLRIVGTVPSLPTGQLSHPYYWSAFILIGNGF